MNFNLIETSIESLWIAERLPKKDKRGHLMRMYCERELLPALNGKKIVQINHTLTKKKELLEVYIFKPNLLKRIKSFYV